ncbi:MAG: DNA-binding protein [Bacillota bacterium]
MWYQKGEKGRTYIGRIPFRGDLLENIQEFAAREKISCARVEAIGAVEKAVISYYNQDKRVYEDRHFDEHLEIMGCLGNLSLRDGKPAAHLHITLGDSEGSLKGGHLQKGTVVFAGEFVIEEIVGPELHREYDPDTGLPLWKKDS